MTKDEFERNIIALIADTFQADATEIGRDTTADDVDGWDSLGHSVLMTRLSRKFGVEIGEDIAGGASNVGMLSDQIWVLCQP